MYLNETIEEIKAMIEQRGRGKAERTLEIKETETGLETMKNDSKAALESGDDKTYIELSGKIAVCEAKLNRLNALTSATADEEKVNRFRNEIMTRYQNEMSKRAHEIEHALNEIIEKVSEMEQIQAEAQKANYRLAELLGTTDTKTGVYLISAASISGLRAEIDKDFQMKNRIPADSGIIPRLMMWAK